ncbi:unnamed protein product [Microthlaspi erraticum]|uniref:NYN domain-containing protein n=1 Tax=Microthlaspi erraticum TaxID=1685480 RepID=A0A6D2JNJ4_9BRAS|nr:unnamed protein product [Microthlaspi erraticum]
MIITITATETFVLWDMADFPLPKDEIGSFYRNVESSVREEGYTSEVTIKAYGHREGSTPVDSDYIHQSIQLVRLHSKFVRVNHMLVEALSFARVFPQSNIMLIMKGMGEEGTEVVRIIKELQKRNCNVFLVVADYDECPLEVKPSCTVWLWESLLEGGFPLLSVSEMKKRTKERRIKERRKEKMKEMMK